MNVYVRDITRELGRMGIQVDVFTRSQDEHVPHVLHDLGYGNRVVHVPAGPEIPLAKDDLVGYIPHFIEKVIEFAKNKRLNYDLIHSHYWMSGVAAIELQKEWKVPLIHMFHTLGVMKQRVARSVGEEEGDERLRGERQILEIAERIVAATPAEYAQLQWLYGADMKRVIVIPPGVDLSRFYPIPMDEAKEVIGLSPSDRMILYVGRIEPLKGIDTLIEAISIYRERGNFKEHPFYLYIIGGNPNLNDEGDNSEMARLHELREQYELHDLVTFLGKKNQDTLPYYYSSSEVVVVPSHYESFGMVALEAMACGTPVVASHIGGLAFLVKDGETGFTVPVSEADAMADRLWDLLHDHQLRERIGKQAADFAKGYSWNKIATRIIDLYREVIEG